jgi:pimeloyl-ACP methyl ester carboxylesterase
MIAIMSDFHPAGTRTMLRAVAEADLRDALPRVRVPTLVLHGEVDRRSSLATARAIHAGIPGARLVVVARVGHAANLEIADRFNAERRRFLASVPAA